jgi:geranylgeranylglycerol-phosphate geranylgeranyltransferase
VTLAERARGLVELTRPTNAVAAGLLPVIGAFVALDVVGPDNTLGIAVASIVTVAATGAGMAINDYFDREIDRVNDPDRPIPRGAVTPTAAAGLSGVLFLVAIGLTVTLLPWLALLIAVINLLALISYTKLFKGLPGVGNALVSYLVGSAFLFGGAAVGNVTATVVLALLAGLANFAREVVKDVEDLAGDRAEGLNTLPIAVGEHKALVGAATALAVAVFASPAPYLRGTFGVAYLVLVIPADAVMLYAAAKSFSNATAGQTLLKYGMFGATASFVVGRLELFL